MSRANGTFVLAGGPRFKPLAHNTVATDRSIFNASPAVPDDVLDRVLDAMRLAPSAGNLQPWRFVVACGWKERAYSKMGGYWDSMAVDVTIAFDHLTLAAAAEGLGTCWIGSFVEEEVRRVLGIPEDVTVVALTPLGYHDVSPTPKTRKQLSEIVCHDRWD